LSGELKMALNFESIHVLGFQVVTALSCMLAFCLNYTIFLNTTLNSALTQTMCGNLKVKFPSLCIITQLHISVQCLRKYEKKDTR
jgi:hypothetical protein